MNLFYINKIVFFGDSLSDDGNLFKVLKGIPKSPPYYEGRFSNGPVWSELLYDKLKDDYIMDYNNYAVGGATVKLHNPLVGSMMYTLKQEVSMYIADHNVDEYDKNLFVIWIGANDYFDDNSSDVDHLTTDVIEELANQIRVLQSRGACNFLLLNLPDLSKTVYAKTLSEQKKLRLTNLIKLHNQKLNALPLYLDHSELEQFEIFDLHYLFNDLLTNPQKYNKLYNINLTIFDDPCWGGKYISNMISDTAVSASTWGIIKTKIFEFIYKYIIPVPMLYVSFIVGHLSDIGQHVALDVDNRVFWDIIHPTRVVHRLISEVVYKHLIGGENHE